MLVRVQLDFAELSLATGDAQGARDRIAQLGKIEDRNLADHAVLIDAYAMDSLGLNPIKKLNRLLESEPVDPMVWVSAQFLRVRILRDRGDTGSAIRAGRAAIAALKDHDVSETHEAGFLFNGVGFAYSLRGEHSQAQALYTRGYELGIRIGDKNLQASSLYGMSITSRGLGDLQRAVALGEEALDLYDRDGDSRDRSRLLSQLGSYHLQFDPPHLEVALEYLKQASTDMRTNSASVTDKGRTQISLARAYLLNHDYEQSLTELHQLTSLGHGVGLVIVAEGELVRGLTLRAMGAVGSEEAFARAVELAGSAGATQQLSNFWFEIAQAREAAGETSAAMEAYRQAAKPSGHSAH